MSYYEEHELETLDRSDRYRKCRLLQDKETGDRLLSMRDIDEIPVSNKDIYHKVELQELGRLDLIAHRYYKNALYWWVIAQANDIYNPIADMKVGMLLRIPTIETLYGYNGILL